MKTFPKLNFIALTSLLFVLYAGATNAQAPQETVRPTNPSSAADAKERQEQYVRSMNYMLKRAKLTRGLAAQHMQFVTQNASDADARKIEDASQVVAYDFVCPDEIMQPAKLDQIATEASYRIAVMAGQSPIAKSLQELAKQQTIGERMELLGDITTTTFMFMVGRRRGLFDSLITDFGQSKFCAGMQQNMRGIYTGLTANPALPE